MVFDNDDDFGVDSFREDASYVFSANEVKVKLIKHNVRKEETLQGDFLGIRVKNDEDPRKFIKINIMSENSEGETQKRHGFDGRGEIVYNCLASYDTDICNKDKIEFINDCGHNIKAGQKFRIVMEDQGMFEGQYCFKNFKLYRI